MTEDEKAASAAHARAARAQQPKKRRYRRRGALKPGDSLPRVRRTRGLVGVRKMAIGVLQQQVESMRDKFLGPEDRQFLIELVKAIALGERVQKMPANGNVVPKGAEISQGAPLPPLSTNGAGK